MSRLFYKEAVGLYDWEKALPLGNGKIGAMVFGQVEKERIQLNEDSVWYGGPIDRINPSAKENLPKIRELIINKNYAEAEDLMRYAFTGTPESARPYQTLGDLHINFTHDEGDVENYERSLDLDHAISNISYEIAGVQYKREIFISKPKNAIVIKLSASEEAKINFEAKISRGVLYDYSRQVGDNGVVMGGKLGADGSDYTLMMKGSTSGGSLEVIGENLIVKDADEAYLYLSAGTTFRHENLLEDIEAFVDEAMTADYDALKEEHVEDYKTLYDRVKFVLDVDNKFEEIPTNVRLANYKEDDSDINLAKILFDFGRYLMIASSREGSLPTTLQGIWNPYMEAPWGSKYTININTEMNYWPAEVTNLSESHMPLFEHLKTMAVRGQKTATEMYGARGWVCHHNTDIWGDTVVQEYWVPGSYWPLGGAWLSTHIWTHYEYTLDKEFLAEMFPILRGAAEFFLDYLVEIDGELKTIPSVSPENTFISDGKTAANDIAVTMDNQILRDLFNACIEAAEVLDIDDPLNQEIKDAVSKLPETKIGKHGQIMEWQEDYDEAEPGHRHVSHLYGLYPSDQITVEHTPALAKAAQTTLQRRLDAGSGHTGWSRAWMICLYARLKDVDLAYDNLKLLLQDSTLPNLFNTHPPFQIDGNFGATAGIAEMLVQSYKDTIYVLPTLPKAWKSGSISGLRVKGNAEVSMSWTDGRLDSLEIVADSDFDATVVYRDESKEISLAAGRKIVLL